MKASCSDIEMYFQPLIGQSPKRARLGYGSFLTFDFGRAFKQNRKFQYEWHLWVQYADWQLTSKGRQIANSDAKRSLIQAAVARLETRALQKVAHEPRNRETRFVFSAEIELVCRAYADSREDERCWALYMPDLHVLLADSSGHLHYLRSDVPKPIHSPA